MMQACMALPDPETYRFDQYQMTFINTFPEFPSDKSLPDRTVTDITITFQKSERGDMWLIDTDAPTWEHAKGNLETTHVIP